jgi:CRISPR-associated protein (TIGR02710 family)
VSKALLVSLGGTPEPIVRAIEAHEPSMVCFLASQDTHHLVADVLSSCSQKFRRHVVLAEDPQDLASCFAAARACVDWLSSQGVRPDDVLVDFTGGTKPMSAALALATIPLGCQLHYVGGSERNKGGIGQVATGAEVLLSQENPWDLLALPQQQRASLLFNRCQYEAARDVLDAARGLARTPRLRQFLEIAVPLMDFFAAWDTFRHREAAHVLRHANLMDHLRVFAAASEEPTVKELLVQVEAGVAFFQRMREATSGFQAGRLCREHVLDLLANATRRACEGKFDDAVARLYRAIEMAAQVRLHTQYGIDTAACAPDSVPESIREDFVRRYGDSGTLKFPLGAAYRLLAERQDEMGLRYMERLGELRDLMSARNHSVLAHGANPVSADTYARFYALALDFTQSSEADLPTFPTWPDFAA